MKLYGNFVTFFHINNVDTNVLNYSFFILFYFYFYFILHLIIIYNIMIKTDFRYFERVSFSQRDTCCSKDGTVVLTLRHSSQFSSTCQTCVTLQVRTYIHRNPLFLRFSSDEDPLKLDFFFI